MGGPAEEPSPPASPGGDEGDPSVAFPTAYAICFALLGERTLARALARRVARRYEDHEGTDPTQWMAALAADAVNASLSADPPEEMPSIGPADAHASVRGAMRRRLASLGERSRATVGLHLLAGHPAGLVARWTSQTPEAVVELCAPALPPPGLTWEDLGDPDAHAVIEPVVRRRRPAAGSARAGRGRRRGGRRTVSLVVATAAVVAVLAVIAWSVTREGERPVLGERIVAEEASFAADLPAVPSAGCAAPAPGQVPGTSDATISAAGHEIAYRLSPPAIIRSSETGAAPLLLALPGTDQDAAAFAKATGLETALTDSWVVTLQPEPVGDGVRGRDDVESTMAVLDAVVTAHCIDLARVHLVGFGRGAQLAGTLACADPSTFATVSMVGGRNMPPDCRLAPPVAALLTANADDDVMPPSGADGIDEVASRWAAAVRAGKEEVAGGSDDTLETTRTGGRGIEVVSILHPSGGAAWTPGDTVAVVAFVAAHARAVG